LKAEKRKAEKAIQEPGGTPDKEATELAHDTKNRMEKVQRKLSALIHQDHRSKSEIMRKDIDNHHQNRYNNWNRAAAA
jgi:hypothetical protein